MAAKCACFCDRGPNVMGLCGAAGTGGAGAAVMQNVESSLKKRCRQLNLKESP